jgi:hypothetical protein
LCHLSLQRSTAQIQSGNRTSRFFFVHAILAPANPDSPMCDGNGSSVHLRLKPLAAPSAINGTLEFGTPLDQLPSSILFLEGILRSPPSSRAIETKAIPPELFIYSNSFRFSRPRFLVLGLQSLPRGLKSSKPWALHARNGFSLSSSQTYY